MNGNEVKAMKTDELTQELGKLRNKLFDLSSQTVTAKVEDNSQFKKTRKDIARLLTEQNVRRTTKA